MSKTKITPYDWQKPKRKTKTPPAKQGPAIAYLDDLQIREIRLLENLVADLRRGNKILRSKSKGMEKALERNRLEIESLRKEIPQCYRERNAALEQERIAKDHVWELSAQIKDRGWQSTGSPNTAFLTKR